jgi:hypothetical protein
MRVHFGLLFSLCLRRECVIVLMYSNLLKYDNVSIQLCCFLSPSGNMIGLSDRMRNMGIHVFLQQVAYSLLPLFESAVDPGSVLLLYSWSPLSYQRGIPNAIKTSYWFPLTPTEAHLCRWKEFYELMSGRYTQGYPRPSVSNDHERSRPSQRMYEAGFYGRCWHGITLVGWNRLRDFSLPGDDLLSQTPLLWMSPMFQVYLTPIYLNCW